MSGPLCPGCGCTFITLGSIVKKQGKPDEQECHCNLCGYEGTIIAGFRVRLTPEAYQHCGELMERKRAGTLLFVRVTAPAERVREVTALLDASTWEKKGEDVCEITVQLDRKPSDETIKKIKALKDVKAVTVF
ncbi:hypothetical protein GF342_01430 [Candidatus Woesearchaeota archaeon]|nr:hypothetical protein [Candidatus Woesearchaeota archaeon]